MKHLRKVLALVLAAVVAVVLGVAPALAAAPTNGTITITDSDGTGKAAGRTFKAYRILDATEVFNDQNEMTGVSYTIPNAAARTALANKFLTTDKTKKDDETDNQYETRIIEAIKTAMTNNAEQAAKDLLSVAKSTDGIVSYELTGGTASDAIPFGYYVIEDVTSPVKSNVSAVMVDTNTPNVSIKVKASEPTLEKKIDEGATAGTIDPTDVEYDNHRVGDDVPYVLESEIPDMTGYTKYFFVVEDTLSKGLTFNNDVAITVDGTALHAGTDYTVTSTANEVGETVVKIVFKDFYTNQKANAGKKLNITYSAKINADAVIGDAGNPNTAKLIFSNNPNSTPTSETDEPGPDDVTGTTPKEQTFTYVTGIKLKKVNPAKEPLSGATFELTGNLNKVEVYVAEKYVQDAAGTYFALKNGTYTTKDPTTISETASNRQELLDKYVDPTGATKFKKATVAEQNASGANGKATATTDSNGLIIFDGMGNGVFTLTETAAPTGYNKLATPIQFEVEWAEPATGQTNCTWSVKENSVTAGYEVQYNAASGEFEITIENNTGTELPSTGGMGTTILYTIGGIMLVGGAIALVSKKRVANMEK